MSKFGSKRTSSMVLAGLLAIGLLALFAAGCGEKDEPDQTGQAQTGTTPAQVEKPPSEPVETESPPGFDEGATADSLASALQTQLTEDSQWQPYRVTGVKVNNDGFTVTTVLPPGQASIAKVDQLCRKLGSPDVFKLLVFGTGPEPLSGKSCGQGP